MDAAPAVSDLDGRAPVLAAAGQDGAGAVVRLAQELIRIDTTNPPGAELPAAQHMAEYLEAAGLEIELQPFDGCRANLVARVRGSGERPGLLFSGHLDTVPVGEETRWTVAPRGGLVKDGRLFGRGSLDMKGSVAAMTVAVAGLGRSRRVPKGDIVVALTAGEETDSCGARMICDAGLLEGVGMAVIGEPTGLDVGIGHRGALWVRADAHGAAAHGSQPDAGLNAVRELLAWLHPFATLEALIAEPEDALLGAGSVSLNIIGGGTSANVVPDRAHAVLDFRTVPGQPHRELLRALERRGAGVMMTVLRDSPPIATPKDAPLVQAVVSAVTDVTGRHDIRGLPYMTDASIFVEALGIPAVVVGPGPEAHAHTEDESVEVAALEHALRIYTSVAEKLMYE